MLGLIVALSAYLTGPARNPGQEDGCGEGRAPNPAATYRGRSPQGRDLLTQAFKLTALILVEP